MAYLPKTVQQYLAVDSGGWLSPCSFPSMLLCLRRRRRWERFSSYSSGFGPSHIGIARAIAFIMGAGFSLTVGQLGMRMAIEGNVRVAARLPKRSFGDALRIAYQRGHHHGMLTDGLGLLGGNHHIYILGIAAPDALLGFGFGGTLLALSCAWVARSFTKAAESARMLVGKVEAGIPEDDPRNPQSSRTSS